MSNYPGPEYLVSGEPDECEHGVPTSHDCVECLRAELDEAEQENERLVGWLEVIEGSDRPCRDERKLRKAAFDALFGQEPPEAL